jgi:uncharacterized protein YcnI
MRTVSLQTLVLMVVIILAGAVAAAQQKSPKYNLADEIKLKGTVESVKQVPNSCSGYTGTHVLLKTEKGLLEVQIAPADFLKELDISFAAGDALEITGAKIKEGESEMVLAREIVRKGNSLVVRDRKGEPVWTWLLKKPA